MTYQPDLYAIRTGMGRLIQDIMKGLRDDGKERN